MGFRPEPTIYKLSFSGTSLDGLHVRASACTVRQHNEMLRAAMLTGKIDEELLSSNNKILDLFADHLISWDLEDAIDGSPIPATREGIDSQERPMIAQIITAWQVAMVNVPNQSRPESSDGSTSVEQSLELGSVSQNLPS